MVTGGIAPNAEGAFIMIYYIILYETALTLYTFIYVLFHLLSYTAGRTAMNAATMTSKSDAAYHKVVTDAVHEHGGAICMQILHTGRYSNVLYAIIILIF